MTNEEAIEVLTIAIAQISPGPGREALEIAIAAIHVYEAPADPTMVYGKAEKLGRRRRRESGR